MHIKTCLCVILFAFIFNFSKAQTSAPVNLSFDDYLAAIKKTDKMVLVDFNAVWCGPCKILKPTVLKLADKNKDKIVLLDIDVDHNPAVARTMNIQSIPLLVLYKNGKEVWRNLGLIDGGTIQDNITKFSRQ